MKIRSGILLSLIDLKLKALAVPPPYSPIFPSTSPTNSYLPLPPIPGHYRRRPPPAVFMGIQVSEVSVTRTPPESMEIARDLGHPSCQGAFSPQELLLIQGGTGRAMESVQQKFDGDARSISMDIKLGAGNKFTSFLKGIMEAEEPRAHCGAKFLLVAIHAVFLDSGFVVVLGENEKVGGGGGSLRLPEGWEDKESSSLSLVYTLKELANEELLANVVVLKLSVVGNVLMVYANLGSYIHHVSLNMERFVPALLRVITSEGEEEKEVYELWKLVKDQLCFPLSIDICEKNGLVLPPCFNKLPSDLKMDIFHLLPAVDTARIGSTCTELRNLSMKDELWINKFQMEFGSLTKGEMRRSGSTWRMRFKNYWLQRKDYNSAWRILFKRHAHPSQRAIQFHLAKTF